MRILTVRHATNYRYARPVTVGQHRLMLRPRDSDDLRLVGAELTLSPPGTVRWLHDVFRRKFDPLAVTRDPSQAIPISAS